MRGRNLPTSDDLGRAIWKICFGNEQFDEVNSLQDLYQVARAQRAKQLTELLRSELTVDSDTLPDWYKLIFSFPWHRCYTLNIDDLPQAADRRFQLPRKIKVTSAMSERSYSSVDERAHLHVIQLNGGLGDVPDNVTFSTPQYAQRLIREEPWYNQLISDLLARPVVFIGTDLDEPPLWQYVEKRQFRGGRAQQELRPKSYLVTPSLSKARESCLIEYNISHIGMTGQVFLAEVLKKVGDESRQTGLQFLYDSLAEQKTAESTLDEVAALATAPNLKTEFLTGAEPIWADIQSGRAIERDVDEQIEKRAMEMLATKDAPRGLLLISGTAGTGKGTSLKRIALTLSSEGHRVAWVDSLNSRSPLAIKRTMSSERPPEVLAMDDPDIYGTELTSLVREVLLTEDHPLIIVAIRSTRIDRNFNTSQLSDFPLYEISMPGLTDKDIGGLLDALQRENRLGVLVDVKRPDQEKIFREKCGRQLLVAMIEATSGKPFREKIKEEFAQLEEEMQRIYALVAVTTAHRFGINKNDLLLAVPSPNNEVLNAIKRLVQRHIVFCEDGWYRARHRVIAEEVFADLALNGQIAEVLLDLTRAAAMQVNPGDPANSRHHRIIRLLLKHEFLKTTIGFEEARYFYASLEPLLCTEHNYWLHRGSLEVEQGSLELGENFLNQARALGGSDMNVQTEYAYLLFRKALKNPAAAHAKEHVAEAITLLNANIAARGAKDPHAYHVLGTNMLEWVDKGISTRLEKKAELEVLSKIIDEAGSKHPANNHIKLLKESVRDAYLSLAVAK